MSLEEFNSAVEEADKLARKPPKAWPQPSRVRVFLWRLEWRIDAVKDYLRVLWNALRNRPYYE